MKIQRLFIVCVFIGLILKVGAIPLTLGVPEVMVLGSSVMLLFICELSGIFRRTAAIEQFLQRKTQQEVISAKHIMPAANVSIDQQTPGRLRRYLELIIGERHPQTSRRHHDAVRDLIQQHLQDCGWDAKLDEFGGSHGPAHNVIAEKRGYGDNPGILIVGAHYDTVKGTSGADDNGIAVAGIMRLGELLGGRRFSKTVRLVAWDLEEQQQFSRGLLGSKHMAKNAAKKGERIEGVICLEMIGMCSHRPNSQTVMPGLRLFAPKLWHHLEQNGFRGNFIATVGNQRAERLIEEFAVSANEIGLPSSSLIVRGLLKFLRDLRRSDHSPFWDHGIPAIMVTDTSNFRSQYYHTALDLPETIDFEFAAKVIEATARVIERHANPHGCTPTMEKAETTRLRNELVVTETD